MTVGLLAQIDGPADVKAVGLEELETLAGQLRREILRVTAANGGHLATNLGNVELTIALHYVLDSPRDKIVWDVGNQCYAHKMLTGRRERFPTIRQTRGLSGFVNRRESPHDPLTAGHAGTALSAALGIAHGRDVVGDDYRVVAVVGDGSMSAGLSYEALNNLDGLDSQLLLILNDNSFSIAPSCGGLSQALGRARERVLDGNVFEQLGVQYLGPVDGHDLGILVEVLREVGRVPHPVVLHVVTQKGRGYEPSESDPARFHGVTPFNLADGLALGTAGAPSYSHIFGDELSKIAARDQRVVAITAAMCAGTGLNTFAEQFPDRFFDVGIAEQHAVTFAAGMAAGGCRPVVAIYSSFLQRGYDQVIHDVCLQDLPVTFVLDRAGVVGADGATHHGVLDLSFLRAVPRLVVMAPKDEAEFRGMLRAAIGHAGPAAVRIPRGAPPAIDAPGSAEPIEIGRAEVLREGGDLALIAVGSMVPTALAAADALADERVEACVINARWIKPLDAELILKTARRVRRVYTLEENVAQGGFGGAILELLAEHGVRTPVGVLALPDEFIEHGAKDVLLDECGLSQVKIVARILDDLRAKRPAPAEVEFCVDLAAGQESIRRLGAAALPEELQFWAAEYGKVGERESFLWKWCLEGVRLTALPCMDDELRETNNVTKVLGVMFDVLLDDVADQSADGPYLERLLQIATASNPPDFDQFSAAQQRYAETAARVWATIAERARAYPRYHEFSDLLRFDYLQLINTMRYSHLVNRDPQLMNLAEHDLYLPHNMHMMISGTLDLMCSSGFDRAELGTLREALWHAQCMGRVGNLVTTWQRELDVKDFTSGVFALAVQRGVLTPQQLIEADAEQLREAIAAGDCESFFLDRWRRHRDEILARAASIRSVDLTELTGGLERLLGIHLASRGLK